MPQKSAEKLHCLSDTRTANVT